MNKALKTLGISAPQESIMSYLMPKGRLDSMGEKEREKILALRKIIREYVMHIPQSNKVQIKKPEDVVKIIHPILKGVMKEQLWIITLTKNNTVINYSLLSEGGIVSTIIDSKVVFSKVLEDYATGFILIHNHPSGSPMPGKSDIDATIKIKKAASLMEVDMLDHIIISDSQYYSFDDERISDIKH